jgi:hypothetical protein
MKGNVPSEPKTPPGAPSTNIAKTLTLSNPSPELDRQQQACRRIRPFLHQNFFGRFSHPEAPAKNSSARHKNALDTRPLPQVNHT